MRAGLHLVSVLCAIPLATLAPVTAAASTGAGHSASSPAGLPEEVQVPPAETSANVIFNDSSGPERPGIPPGGPARPLVQPTLSGVTRDGPEKNTGALPDPEVLGFAQTGEVTSGDWQSDFNLGLLSTIAYDSININSDGSVIQDSGYQGWWSGQMTNLMNAAHTAGDRVVLAVTDFSSSSIESVVSNSAYTQTAVNAIVQQVERGGGAADGVNVDFEGLTPTVSPSAFTGFVAQLRSALIGQIPGHDDLTVDTYASSYQGGSMMNIPALSPYVDAFDVMDYDIEYGSTLPNAPLAGAYTHSTTNVVDGYLREVPAWQVVLGIPYYGYVYSTTSSGFHAPRGGDDEMGAVTYSGVLSDFSCGLSQLTESWDSPSQTPWASWWSPSSSANCGGHNSFRELYYDNARSLGDKYDLVNSDGLRGIGIWALGYDSGSGDLWSEIASKFSVQHGNPPPPPSPTITSMSPSVGPTSGGSTVTVSGYDFASGMTLTFDGAPLPTASVTPISFTFTTPSNPAGAVSLSVSDTWGQSTTVSYIYAAPSQYQPLSPFRILDTRSATCVNCTGGALGPGAVRTLTIAGYHDPATGQTIPSAGVTAVVINLTAVSSTAGTVLAVNPTGTAGPAASSLNAPPGRNIANLVVAPLGTAGRIDIWNSLGSVNVVADVVGYYTSVSSSTGLYHALSPSVRTCDTRTGNGTVCSGGAASPLGPGQRRLVAVTGGSTGVVTGGDAEAAALNLTAVSGSSFTYLSVYPPTGGGSVAPSCGAPPVASNLNVPALTNEANRLITPVVQYGGTGYVCVFNDLGVINVVVDVNGWFGTGGDTGGLLFHPLGPTRICDTRPDQGPLAALPCAGQTLTAGGTLVVQVGGAAGLPASGISALAVNLTAVAGTAGTYLAVDPDGAVGSTSDVNADAQENIANLVMLGVPADQRIDVYNSQGSIDVVLDAEGWFG